MLFYNLFTIYVHQEFNFRVMATLSTAAGNVLKNIFWKIA